VRVVVAVSKYFVRWQVGFATAFLRHGLLVFLPLEALELDPIVELLLDAIERARLRPSFPRSVRAWLRWQLGDEP
jgi:hypothetical protein